MASCLCSLDLLLGQTSGQGQAKRLTGDDRFKIRVTAHGALLALMVRCAWSALATAPVAAFALVEASPPKPPAADPDVVMDWMVQAPECLTGLLDPQASGSASPPQSGAVAVQPERIKACQSATAS